jgi:glycosyltransferase involved in cell wall biosynthesis
MPVIFGIYVLSEDPPVFALWDNNVPALLPLLPPNLSPHLLIFPMWSCESYAAAAKARWRYRRMGTRRLYWMCCTPLEAQRLAAVGYQTVWCHQNLLCDETVLRPTPAEKTYDAVYIATIAPYKRLDLARGIPKLRLITRSLDQVGQLPELGLGHAVVNEKQLNAAELAAALSQCRVGLALSAVEGGMFACTEYLFCDLPVVTTPSLGGRDAWLDEGNSLTVAPDLDAVTAAVRHLIDRPPDPNAVRTDAVRRARFHRAVLAETVRRITNRLPYDAESIDGSWFFRHFVSFDFLSEYLQSYANGRFGRSDLLGRLAE